ncbi:MAG: hypothetical protein ACXVB0_04690 [Mucilaginibacter sp.]
MKNSLKITFLALIIAVSVASCGDGDKANSTTKIDTGKTAIDTSKKTIDTSKKTAVDTTKKH